jgi:hypothetical protein
VIAVETNEQWLSFREAVELVRARLGWSIGRCEATVGAAHDSGEVRYRPAMDGWFLISDDGIMDQAAERAIEQAAEAELKDPRRQQFNENDLIDWLDRQASEQPAPAAKQGEKRRTAKEAVKAIWPRGKPPVILSNPQICAEVNHWLKENAEGMIIGDTTILRAAGRKK